jgi:hypothetical protein
MITSMNTSIIPALLVLPSFSWLSTIFALFTILLISRQLLIVFAAEQGRKQDLVKKLYKNSHPYPLSVLIPFLKPDDHAALLTLLSSLQQQHYPLNRVMIHLATTSESHHVLIPKTLQPNVKIWKFPGDTVPGVQQAMTWLIERCLAAGGNSLFVFLKATDLVKPDFFQSVSAQGATSFAIQGYVAFKNPPRTLLERVNTLTKRLLNRVGNAGRYHLGLSCHLQDTGWAIKQEVLEMIQYRWGFSADNLEYTIRLGLENFNVTWAPNVVVYSDSHLNMAEETSSQLSSLLSRFSTLSHYGGQLFTRSLFKFNGNALDHLISLFTPPLMVMTIMLAVFALLDLLNETIVPGPSFLWQLTALSTLGLSFIALGVSRCKVSDLLTLLVYVPVTYLGSFVALPSAIPNCINTIMSTGQRQKGNRYRQARQTRFNDRLSDQGEEDSYVVKSDFDDLDLFMPKDNRLPVSTKDYPDETALTENDDKPGTHEMVQTVMLSNQKKQVECQLVQVTIRQPSGQTVFYLKLEYKTIAFTTQSYRILDQAFYELQAKLMDRGLSVVTCGSCGYFYNPTVDVPEKIRNSGVCLYNKLGQEVSLESDAVTVVTQPCRAHCPLSQRETLVSEWKQSLV